LEVLLGCNDLPAELAERYGYINRALPADELTAFVEKLAHLMASFPAHAIAHAKAAVISRSPGILPKSNRCYCGSKRIGR
jgi:enoyl-CoA hydratase/carnithine racemase